MDIGQKFLCLATWHMVLYLHVTIIVLGVHGWAHSHCGTFRRLTAETEQT